MIVGTTSTRHNIAEGQAVAAAHAKLELLLDLEAVIRKGVNAGSVVRWLNEKKREALKEIPREYEMGEGLVSVHKMFGEEP